MNILAGNNNSWTDATNNENTNNGQHPSQYNNNNNNTQQQQQHQNAYTKNNNNSHPPLTSPPGQSIYSSLYNNPGKHQPAGYLHTNPYYQLTPPPSIKQETPTAKSQPDSNSSGTSSPQNHQHFRPANFYAYQQKSVPFAGFSCSRGPAVFDFPVSTWPGGWTE